MLSFTIILSNQGRSQDFSLGRGGRVRGHRSTCASRTHPTQVDLYRCPPPQFGVRRGVPPHSGWGRSGEVPPLQNFLNFYIKMVSCRAFWVAISCRFLPECEVRVELKFKGDRFTILGTIYTFSGKKIQKNAQKLLKKITKTALFFLYIRI